MFGHTRWSAFDDMLTLHRAVDRLVNQVWSDLPARPAASWSPSFEVRTSDDAWTIEVPLPGIDPARVTLEAAGNTLTIRLRSDDGETDQNAARVERTLTVPPFLALDKITATHRHGMLALTIPVKEAVRPRRIPIEVEAGDTRRLTAAA
jgi:HSP20 family protein